MFKNIQNFNDDQWHSSKVELHGSLRSYYWESDISVGSREHIYFSLFLSNDHQSS